MMGQRQVDQAARSRQPLAQVNRSLCRSVAICCAIAVDASLIAADANKGALLL
jgi:hypothetical protein